MVKTATRLADTGARETTDLRRAVGSVFRVVIIVFVVDVSVAMVMGKLPIMAVVTVVMSVLVGVAIIAVMVLVLARVTVIPVMMGMFGIVAVFAMMMIVMRLGVRLGVAIGQGGERADGGKAQGDSYGCRQRAQENPGFHGAGLLSLCVRHY
jgi:hypothetical protein